MRPSLVAAAWLVAVLPWPAGAQRVLSLGMAGGVSVPQGSLSDGASAGWHALGTLVLSAPTQPLGIRADVAYNRFAFSDGVGEAAGTRGHHSVGSATANVTYRLPMTDSPMSPYLISGLGAYRSDCSAGAACEATTRYGWNVGLGTKLYAFRVRSFIEARYHRTARGQRTIQYFPITVGIML
jgi:hypothetical protein